MRTLRRSSRLQAKAARSQVVATENSSGKQPSHPLSRPNPKSGSAESKGRTRTVLTQTPSGSRKEAPKTQATNPKDVNPNVAQETSDDVVDWDSNPRLTDRVVDWLLAHPMEAAILFADSDEEGDSDVEGDANRTESGHGDVDDEGQIGSHHDNDLHPEVTPASMSYEGFDVERAVADETPDALDDRNASILQWIATTARYSSQWGDNRVPCASLKHQSYLRDSRVAFRSMPYPRPPRSVLSTLTQRMRAKDTTYLDSKGDEERREIERMDYQHAMELKQLKIGLLREEVSVLELKLQIEMERLTGGSTRNAGIVDGRANAVSAVRFDLPRPICPLTNLPLVPTPYNIS